MNVSQVLFYSPSRAVECRFFGQGVVACASFRSGRMVILDDRRAAQIFAAREFGHALAQCKVPGPSSEDPVCGFERRGRGPVLPDGASIDDPRGDVAPGYGWRPSYRCTTSTAAVVCRSLESGLGFRIAPTGVHRLSLS